MATCARQAVANPLRAALSSSSPSLARQQLRRRTFHSSPFRARQVAVGDSLPDVELVENSPGNKVSPAKTLSKGKGLIIGVPAAFSPGCSQRHIPGYIKHPAVGDGTAGKVFVVSVNDPFVMKAWAESFDSNKQSSIRFLGDPHATFTNALDLAFDGATAIFGQPRSKRYALVIEDGKVTGVHVEPDNTGVDVSAAEKVLGAP